MSMRKFVGLLPWIPVGIFIDKELLHIQRIHDDTMSPTLKVSGLGDVVLVDRRMASWMNPRRKWDYDRGAVVILSSPSDPRKTECMRLIGLPGDIVALPGSGEKVLVKRGSCWVESDMGAHKTSSKTSQRIPQALLRGQVVCRIWPPTRVGRIEKWYPKNRVVRSEDLYPRDYSPLKRPPKYW